MAIQIRVKHSDDLREGFSPETFWPVTNTTSAGTWRNLQRSKMHDYYRFCFPGNFHKFHYELEGWNGVGNGMSNTLFRSHSFELSGEYFTDLNIKEGDIVNLRVTIGDPWTFSGLEIWVNGMKTINPTVKFLGYVSPTRNLTTFTPGVKLGLHLYDNSATTAVIPSFYPGVLTEAEGEEIPELTALESREVDISVYIPEAVKPLVSAVNVSGITSCVRNSVRKGDSETMVKLGPDVITTLLLAEGKSAPFDGTKYITTTEGSDTLKISMNLTPSQ